MRNFGIYEEFDFQESPKVGNLSDNQKNKMNQTMNAGLNVIGTGLIALGATSIHGDLKQGLVEIILGLVVFVVYEFTPSK